MRLLSAFMCWNSDDEWGEIKRIIATFIRGLIKISPMSCYTKSWSPVANCLKWHKKKIKINKTKKRKLMKSKEGDSRWVDEQPGVYLNCLFVCLFVIEHRVEVQQGRRGDTCLAEARRNMQKWFKHLEQIELSFGFHFGGCRSRLKNLRSLLGIFHTGTIFLWEGRTEDVHHPTVAPRYA